MPTITIIKSMSPSPSQPGSPVTPTSNMTFFEAGKKISTVVTEFVTKRKADATDTLRTTLMKPDNGEQLTSESIIKSGDIIVISAKEFTDGFSAIGAHAMILYMISKDPFKADIYELVNSDRNEHTIHIGQKLDTRMPSMKMQFAISPEVTDARTERFINRNISAGTAFRLKVHGGDVYNAFMQVSDELEEKRQKLSKYPDCDTGMYYGSYRCNNFIADVVKRALEIKSSGEISV